MAYAYNTGALLAGLAWMPWTEDASGECPAAIVEFLGSLGIIPPKALTGSSRKTALSAWLKTELQRSPHERVRWLEVGIHTMVVSSMFASGAPPRMSEDAIMAYHVVLQHAGVSLEARDRIADRVRELALAPKDQQIFARLLETLEEQSRVQSTATLPRPPINHRAAASYYLTVAVVILIALASFFINASRPYLPFILAGGLLLMIAVGCYGVFRNLGRGL